jgi:hypothetical protein
MVSVIFVHGISIRAAEYRISFERIQEALRQRSSNTSLVPCLWGDDFGAKLLANGVSIPRYRQARGIEDHPSAIDEQDRWELLFEDPLLELRLLALRPPAPPPPFDPRGAKLPSQTLRERIRTFKPSDKMTQDLRKAGFSEDELETARQRVVEAPAFDKALKASGEDLGEFRLAWARAVKATMLAEKVEVSTIDVDLIDSQSLSGLATTLADEVGDQPKGFLRDWLKEALTAVGTRVLYSRRGSYSDAVVPFIGDVLVYQGNGQPIRDLISRCIQGVGDGTPVVLLGHSLGGIACVDLLAEKAYPAVKLLITVGSQSPLFYELNALQKLRFGEPLPGHFPRWLNIYDQRDFLSYVAQPVFKDSRVTDVEVNNRQRFPRSHSAYWSNPNFWDVIVPKLAEVAR